MQQGLSDRAGQGLGPPDIGMQICTNDVRLYVCGLVTSIKGNSLTLGSTVNLNHCSLSVVVFR